MDESAGVCAGSLIGFFTFGTTLSSLFLGYLADLYGRKRFVMMGLFTSAISINLYGFSTSFWVAASLRIFAGLTNANATLSSAICADVTSGKQRVLAFGYLWGVWGLSGLLAGTIGGIFSRPQFQLFTPWGNRFWFPCFLASCWNTISLIAIGLFLPETLPQQVGAMDQKQRTGAPLEVEMSEYDVDERCDEEDPMAPLIIEVATKNEVEDEKVEFSLVERFSQGGKILFVSDPLRRLLCLVYCVNSFANGSAIALLVLFASAPISSGGLGYSSFETGLLLTWQSVISLAFQAGCFKKVSYLLKSNYIFYCIGLLFYLVGCIFYPLSSFPSRSSDMPNHQSIFFSMFSTTFLAIAGMIVLPVLGSMQSNVSPPELQGLSMGIIQSLSFFFRSFGPIVAGYFLDFFAQYHFVGGSYIIPVLSYILCYLLISRMTKEDKERAEISQRETIIPFEENFEIQEETQLESKLFDDDSLEESFNSDSEEEFII